VITLDGNAALSPHPFLAEIALMIEVERIDVELIIISTGEVAHT